jgi:hypothetical protein
VDEIEFADYIDMVAQHERRHHPEDGFVMVSEYLTRHEAELANLELERRGLKTRFMFAETIRLGRAGEQGRA